jgi:hypothetical protein
MNPPNHPFHQRAIDYINNTGSTILPIKVFDEDHEPIGPTLRSEMKRLGIIEETEGMVVLHTDYIDLNKVKLKF